MTRKPTRLTLGLGLAVLLTLGCAGFEPPEWNAGEWALYRLPQQRTTLRLELLPALETHLLLQLTYESCTELTVIQLELERSTIESFTKDYYELIDDPEARGLGREALVELCGALFAGAETARIHESPGPIRELDGAALWAEISPAIPTTAPANERFTVVDFLWKPDTRRTPCLLISMEGGVLMLSEEVPIAALVHLHLGGPTEPLWLELKDFDYTGAVDALLDIGHAVRAPERSTTD